jgi:hypothetical protein
VFKYNYTNFESTGIMSLLDSQYIGPNAIKDHTKFYNTMETLYINDTVPYTKKRIVGRYGITANENTERSLIFLRWVATDPELNRLLCYGVEDVHYKFQDGRYYVPGDVFKIVNNFCKPTSPLIHILDPVGYKEFLEYVETDEKQIIPGIPNERIFSSFSDDYLFNRSNLIKNFFGDGNNRPILPENATLQEFREMLRSKERDQFVKDYQKRIDGE